MKTLFVVLALGLYGCGGPVFSVAAAHDDAGHAVVEASTDDVAATTDAVETTTVGADSGSLMVNAQKPDSSSIAIDSDSGDTTIDAAPDVLDSSSALCCTTFEGPNTNLVAVPCNPSAPTWFCSVNGSDVSCDDCPPQSLCSVLGQGEHPYGGLVGSCS
jgi:hypothetical protein